MDYQLPGRSSETLEGLWARMWETLDLPQPKFRRFEDRWQWLRWGEWEAFRRRRGDPFIHSAYWQLIMRPDAHGPGREELDARLRRWMELEDRARRREPAEFPEVVALQALELLRRIDSWCREADDKEQFAVCLSLQAALLAGSLAREEEARQLWEEAWALGEGEEGWRIHVAVEQALAFFNGWNHPGEYLDFFNGT